jgi:primosomal protein N'
MKRMYGYQCPLCGGDIYYDQEDDMYNCHECDFSTDQLSQCEEGE